MQMADSLKELATMICSHGFYAYHKDDIEYPIPKDAVREYLEVGAMFQQSRVWHPKSKLPDNDSHILIVNDYSIATAGVYYADLGFFAPTGMGRARRWNDWNLDRWAYISDLVPKKEKEDSV